MISNWRWGLKLAAVQTMSLAAVLRERAVPGLEEELGEIAECLEVLSLKQEEVLGWESAGAEVGVLALGLVVRAAEQGSQPF